MFSEKGKTQFGGNNFFLYSTLSSKQLSESLGFQVTDTIEDIRRLPGRQGRQIFGHCLTELKSHNIFYILGVKTIKRMGCRVSGNREAATVNRGGGETSTAPKRVFNLPINPWLVISQPRGETTNHASNYFVSFFKI